eukprot:TRINITY_DN2557_c0_g1_i1.p1 TRINITY_DN2557_c0_g1~~TRINITY_DN2557_c0_g1_i1.p1  ORF type:complete len:426 (-),score=119.25 TRINITY_DN2557_c0_g1_i1:174-1451(-)
MKRGATKTKATQPTKKARVEIQIASPEVIEHGQIFAYGGGDCSQLTDQYSHEKEYPVPLRAFKDTTVLDIQSSGYHTALLMKEEDGKVSLYTWGCNDDGVLGRVTEGDSESEPGRVELDDVVKIAVGDYHMCALTADGQLYGWGSYKDEEGFLGLQIGLAKRDKQRTPLPFDFDVLKGQKIVDIASSSNTTIVLTSTGRVYQWGCTKQILEKKSPRLAQKNDRDQLLPHNVIVPKAGKRVFSGGNHHFVVTTDGELYGWGINGFGQLGSGDTKPHERPKRVKGVSKVIDVACGVAHTLILCEDGVYSCGRNAYGQLGLGDAEKQDGVEQFPPKIVVQKITWFDENLENDEIVQVECGDNHSVALSKKGDLYTWGFGDAFRLGTSSEDDETSPKKVDGKWANERVGKYITAGTDFGLLVAVASTKK